MKMSLVFSPRALCFRPALALLLCGALCSCTTMKVVSVPVEPSQPVAVHTGEKVEVLLKFGPTLTFEVASVDATALVGKDGTRVAVADIRELKVSRVDPLRTTGAVAGSFVGVTVLLFLVLLATHGLSIGLGPM